MSQLFMTFRHDIMTFHPLHGRDGLIKKVKFSDLMKLKDNFDRVKNYDWFRGIINYVKLLRGKYNLHYVKTIINYHLEFIQLIHYINSKH